MEWSPEQDAALVKASKWFQDESAAQIFALFGYAGVGKTTLAVELARSSGLNVGFAAYTGKAAYVMRQKGCDGCRTIHSLIYKPAGESKSDELRRIEMELAKVIGDPPKDKETAQKIRERLEKQRDELLMKDRPKPMWSLNPDSELHELDALIVDECSMVDEDMGVDLLSYGKKILVLGDPAQLPPVGSGGFFTNRRPDVLLTEIHRHAKDSGILRLATDVRTTGEFSRTPGYYGADCVVTPKSKVENLQQLCLDADQILVGLNKTRHGANARFRELSGKGDSPTPTGGDKIVCLRNNRKAGLLNGSLWRVHESAVADEETVDLVISSEEDGASGVAVTCWQHPFMGRDAELRLKRWKRTDHNEFDYGYALTTHKAQGSQWDEVALFDESWAFRNDKTKWLYTAVTRAAKKLTVLL